MPTWKEAKPIQILTDLNNYKKMIQAESYPSILAASLVGYTTGEIAYLENKVPPYQYMHLDQSLSEEKAIWEIDE